MGLLSDSCIHIGTLPLSTTGGQYTGCCAARGTLLARGGAGPGTAGAGFGTAGVGRGGGGGGEGGGGEGGGSSDSEAGSGGRASASGFFLRGEVRERVTG